MCVCFTTISENDNPDDTEQPSVTVSTTDDCRDSDPFCVDWADAGDCERHPDWMEVHCRASCHICNSPQIHKQPSDLPPVFEDDPNCVDSDIYCIDWADVGDCETDPEWMEVNCQKSCGLCNNPYITGDYDPNCFDSELYCVDWAEAGDCDIDPEWMHLNCRGSCGLCNNTDLDLPTVPPVYVYEPDCEDSDPLCPSWAIEGGCYFNPAWMLPNCAYSCNSCDYIDSDDVQFETGPSEQTGTDCKDSHKLCQEWASIGGCYSYPEWMVENCRVSCNLCTAEEETPTDSVSLPVETTESPESSLLDSTDEDVYSSDSWNESQFDYSWQESNSEDTFQGSESSESSDDITTIDWLYDGDSVESIDEVIIQSAFEVTQSVVTVETETTEQLISETSKEIIESEISVTTSSYRITALQSEFDKDTLREVTDTLLHGVTEQQLNETGYDEYDLLTESENRDSLNESGASMYITKPQNSLHESPSTTTDLDKEITKPTTDVIKESSHRPTVSSDAITDAQRQRTHSSQEVDVSSSTSEMNEELVTGVTDTLRGSSDISVTLLSDSNNSLSANSGSSNESTYPTITVTVLENELTDETTYSTSTIIPNTMIDSVDNWTQTHGELINSSTLFTDDELNDVNQPTELYTLSIFNADFTDSKVTESTNTFTESSNQRSESHTTLRDLFRKFTQSTTSIPQDANTWNTNGQTSQPQYSVLPTEVNQNEVIKTDLPNKNPHVDCVDNNKYCHAWAFHGGCKISPSYMLKNCRVSCNSCDLDNNGNDELLGQGSARESLDFNDEDIFTTPYTEPSITTVLLDVPDVPNQVPKTDCVDYNKFCPIWESYGGCQSNPLFMLPNCRLSCNSCDYVSIFEDDYDDGSGSESVDTPSQSQNQVTNDELIPTNEVPEPASSTNEIPEQDCVDLSKLCVLWAMDGGCKENPGWMLPNCRKSCTSCYFPEGKGNYTGLSHLSSVYFYDHIINGFHHWLLPE